MTPMKNTRRSTGYALSRVSWFESSLAGFASVLPARMRYELDRKTWLHIDSETVATVGALSEKRSLEFHVRRILRRVL